MRLILTALLFAALFGPRESLAQSANPAWASEAKIIKARPLPLDAVRLTGGPLEHAQELDSQYLLELQPDRMLAYLRIRAGLEPKAKGYGGWDGAGRQLTGHIAGHYLSAVSLMYAATGDMRFKQRADYIVSELKQIQDAQGDGYIGALLDKDGVDGKLHFQELCKGVIKSSGFDLNGLWSPWYVEHKIFAGLRDAYRYTGSRSALDVEVKFAGWADNILSKMSDDQIQKMLNAEFGGMNEVAADLYADTGDPRWLALSDRFEQRSFVNPLAQGEDTLGGHHGNTNVPKMIGELARYIYRGNETDGKAATYFWDQVALHHSFATGGHGRNEYFGPPDRLNDLVDGRTAETCNVYNMIKMSRTLFSVKPEIRYADFHERALFNHILASQDPADGRVCYMVPVGRGVQHEYQDKFEDFTCCVGTGMESHALHGYGIYYESGDQLWVNLYAPTIANWKSAGVQVEMQTDFPAGEKASLTVKSGPSKKFILALRRPYWAGAGFSVKVDGVVLRNLPPSDSYVKITRMWKKGDRVELTLPKTLRIEPLPDNPHRLAVMWGPLVLAGDLGPEIGGSRKAEDLNLLVGEAPVMVTAALPVNQWLSPVNGKPGEFRSTGVGPGSNIDFVPFYQMPRRRYAIYWDMYTPEEWKKKSEQYAAEQEKQRQLEAATVSFAQPGQMQAERDASEQGEESEPLQLEGHYGRRARKWFSMDLPVDSADPMILRVTYSTDASHDGSFDVLVDGTKIGDQKTQRRSPEKEIHFFDVEYPLTGNAVAGKSKVTVRFEAEGDGEVPGVFGIRILRTDGQR